LRQRLAETSSDDAHPLDIHGRRVIDCHEQLVGILRNRLGQNHADFFAQPVQAAGARSIVWYTTLPGEVSLVNALAPDEQRRLTQRAERILSDVEGLAVQTAADGPAGRTVGDMLRAAAQVVSGASLYSVGGKVVTVLWGHRSASAAHAPASVPPAHAAPPRADAPVHATMQRAAASTVVHPRAADKVQPQRPVWLVPAACALLVLALVAWWAWHTDLLVRVAGPGAELSAQIAAVEARNQTLATRIAELKKNPAALKCVPAPVPAPGPRAPGPQVPGKQSLRSPAAISPVSRTIAIQGRAFASWSSTRPVCAGSYACREHVVLAAAAAEL